MEKKDFKPRYLRVEDFENVGRYESMFEKAYYGDHYNPAGTHYQIPAPVLAACLTDSAEINTIVKACERLAKQVFFIYSRLDFKSAVPVALFDVDDVVECYTDSEGIKHFGNSHTLEELVKILNRYAEIVNSGLIGNYELSEALDIVKRNPSLFSPDCIDKLNHPSPHAWHTDAEKNELVSFGATSVIRVTISTDDFSVLHIDKMSEILRTPNGTEFIADQDRANKCDMRISYLHQSECKGWETPKDSPQKWTLGKLTAKKAAAWFDWIDTTTKQRAEYINGKTNKETEISTRLLATGFKKRTETEYTKEMNGIQCTAHVCNGQFWREYKIWSHKELDEIFAL